MSIRAIRAWVGLALAAAVGLLGAGRHGVAQPLAMFKGTNIAWPDFYDPPNQNQMRSLLTSARVEPQGNGRFLLHEARLETYATNGVRELTITTPGCVYDVPKGTVSSTEPIQVRSDDGRLRSQGKGFVWRLGERTLIITNHIESVFRLQPRGPEPPKQ